MVNVATTHPRASAPRHLFALPTKEEVQHDPAATAYLLLRAGFVILPIVVGIDKFFDELVVWHKYLWSGVIDVLPWTPTEIMYGVGIVEIVAGLIVLAAPRVGSALVAVWLGAVVTNLVLYGIDEGEYWDIALRDFGLCIGAVALFLLSWKYAPRRSRAGA